MSNVHVPVLLSKVLDFMFEASESTTANSTNQSLTVFDGTFGGGGYSEAIAKKCLETNQIYNIFACDLDEVEIPTDLQSTKLPNTFGLEKSDFADYIASFADEFFDYIVLDLGFSTNQLEASGRGFSYFQLADPLDLRYNDFEGTPCYQKFIHLDGPIELSRILFKYSGEKMSKRVATAIWNLTTNRPRKSIITVEEIVEAITEVIPAKFIKQKNSILSRIWQSLRIWTNDELASLEAFLPVSIDKLKVGGRLLIVDFHSLEDKIVAKFMRKESELIEVDEFGNKIQNFKLLTPKPIPPSDQEIEQNKKSRSANLRVLQKL